MGRAPSSLAPLFKSLSNSGFQGKKQINSAKPSLSLLLAVPTPSTSPTKTLTGRTLTSSSNTPPLPLNKFRARSSTANYFILHFWVGSSPPCSILFCLFGSGEPPCCFYLVFGVGVFCIFQAVALAPRAAQSQAALTGSHRADPRNFL